jgi:hypothetical protein
MGWGHARAALTPPTMSLVGAKRTCTGVPRKRLASLKRATMRDPGPRPNVLASGGDHRCLPRPEQGEIERRRQHQRRIGIGGAGRNQHVQHEGDPVSSEIRGIFRCPDGALNGRDDSGTRSPAGADQKVSWGRTPLTCYRPISTRRASWGGSLALTAVAAVG